MFDDDENGSEEPSERAAGPEEEAKEKSDGFRMHAELAAVFEGARKFEAEILTDLETNLARDIQKTMAKLEKAKVAESPLIEPDSFDDAAALLDFPRTKKLSTNDYHISRRPGEVMIVRWLAGEQVATFYERLQAHFDAALTQFRTDERQAHGWKQDQAKHKYLEALDALEIKMADRYLRGVIREHQVFVLSTQSADEIDILYLCDYVMGTEAAQVVGEASAPPEQPTEGDRAWFFKLFSLRGMLEKEERMCFFTFLQKSDEGW
ncbi:MAG TPA: hypothetical protein VF669_02595 [Tepidisphaeraceae bacterium]|jgi:hypothetical protein